MSVYNPILSKGDNHQLVPTRSAAKAHRQSVKRNLRNRAARSAVRTALKKAEASVLSGSTEEATQVTRLAVSNLDRAARKGIIHPNNARRRKSRLVRKLNLATAESSQSPTSKGKAAKKTGAATHSKKSGE